MSLIATGYERSSSVDVDSYLASRGAASFKNRNAGSGAEDHAINATTGDEVTLSKQALIMSSKPRSQEELESLSYEPFLSFTLDDGAQVAIEKGYGGNGEDPSSLRIVVSHADGTNETIYIDGTFKENPAEEPEEALPLTEATASDEESEHAPTLLELIEARGLGTVNAEEAGQALSDAIVSRIKSMVEASEKTRKEQEELEKLKASRNEAAAPSEEENKSAATTAALHMKSDSAEPQTTDAETALPSGKIAGYTSRGKAYAAQSGASSSGFSRRY